MISIETKVSGDLENALDNYAKAIQEKVVMSGVAAAANVIYEEVKRNTSGERAKKYARNFVGPRPETPPGKLTGNLHNAIYRVFSPERSTDEVKVYKVSVNKKKAPHWHLIEFGWSRAPAHPYIRPAADKMGKAINAGLARMSRRLDEITIEGK